MLLWALIPIPNKNDNVVFIGNWNQSPAEYPALLKDVYRHADLSKPRNLLGLSKDLPLADIKVGDEAMRELALQRAVGVKDYLAAKDLPLERLFLGAAKTVPPEAKWTPHAELNLAMP